MKLPEMLNTVDLQEFTNAPSGLADRAIELQMAIANHPDAPHSLLEILVASSHPDVARAASLHVNWAGEIAGDWQETLDAAMQTAQLGQNDRLAVELLKFAPVPECFLSEWVPPERIAPGLTNPYLPLKYLVKLLDRLAKETTLEPRLQVAESPLAPLSLLEQLAGDLELPVRLAVQSNPKTPPQLIEFAQAQYSAARDWNTDSQQLAQLAQSRWVRVRLAVAQNPSASVETLMQLAGDSLFKIPLAVAKNPQTPATILAVLAEHSESSIRQAVAQHPNASEEIMHQLFPDCLDMLRNRKNLPASILERFFREAATDKPIWQQQELRYLFLEQSNTPAWILAELADVNLEELRAEKLTKYQYAPEPDLLETWMQDDTMFLAEIAKHPQVLPETLERLSHYSNPWVQLAVAHNLKTPETLRLRLLEALSVNTNERIQVKVAKNINTPVCILEAMVQNESYQTKLLREIRRLLGSNYKQNADSFHTTADQTLSDLKHEVLYPANIAIDVDRWIEAIQNSGILEILSRTLNYGSFVYREIDTEIPLWSELLPGLSAEQHKRAIETLFQALNMINSNVRHHSTYRSVGVALTGNPNTPAALREQLKTQLIRPATQLNFYNNDCDIFLALAYNPALPETERREYFNQLITSGYAIETIAKDPRTPLDILEQLVELGAIQAVAENPAIPAWLLTRIADLPLPREWVLRTIAENRNAPAHLLLRLARHPHDPTISNVTMLDLVLANPNLPVLERYRLLLEQKQHKEDAKSREFMSRRPQSLYALSEAIASDDRTALFNAARNPNTPVSILTQIAKHPDESVRGVLADNRDLPLSISLELTLDPSLLVRRKLAYKHCYRQTSVQVLEVLANDESAWVRELVAGNSDTPLEILVKLANDSNREVKAKVAGNLNTPTAVLERLGLEEGIFCARNPNTPGSVLAKAVSQMSGDELADFLRHPVQNSQMPASTLEQLANRNNNSIRYRVAKHPNTPASALEKLAGDSDIFTIMNVASHSNTPPRILEQLAANSDYTTRYNVAQNPNTPPAALEIIARYKETETNAPLIVISSNQKHEIYRIIAANPRTPLAALEMLAAREFVTELETEELRDAAMFSGCNIEGVLEALVYNNSLTPQILAILALDPSPKIRSLLARRDNLTPELWQQLAADEDEEVRGAIASSINCSTSILQTLALDSYTEVRRAVAQNRNTTVNTLEFLSQDLNSQVRETVAFNPNTATSILKQLARDEQVEVRRTVARNPKTPIFIRESLQNSIAQPYTRESSPTLRCLGRIYNPDTDDLPTLLSEYAQSANAFVRFVALMHPLTPVSILAQGSQSLSWLERCAVADNPSTPVKILEPLDRDSNRIARAIAQTHLQW